MENQAIKEAVVKFLLREGILLEGNTEWFLTRQDGSELIFNDLIIKFTKEWTEQRSDLLGRSIDRVESMLCALNIPMHAQMHVDGFKSTLPEIVEELKQGYVAVVGDNPWDTTDYVI